MIVSTAPMTERAEAPAGNEFAPSAEHPGRQSVKTVHFISLLRRRLLHAVSLAVAFTASDIVQWSVQTDSVPDLLQSVAGTLLDKLASFPVLVVALTTIQVLMPASRGRLPVMIAAIIAISVAINEPRVLALWRNAFGVTVAEFDFYSLYLYLSWGAIASGTLLAIFYEWQARMERVTEAMRTARIAAEIVERKILDARLSSLKAKVDPELLFAVVGRAQTLYGRSTDAAEALLERLIEFLRASLPHSQALTVTVEQEVMLCRLYLELENAMREDTSSFETRIDPALAKFYFPPAVLLPLLQAILAALTSLAQRPHLSIIAGSESECVRIELTCHAASPPPPRDALDAALEALRKFFGEGVSIVAIAAPFSGRLIRIEVPYVAT